MPPSAAMSARPAPSPSGTPRSSGPASTSTGCTTSTRTSSGRIDLLPGKDGKKGPDGAYTAVEPAEGAVRPDNTADIAETLHIGRIGVLDEDYAPLVIDGGPRPAAPFYRSTPVDPGRVVRCLGRTARRDAGCRASRTT
ncbi:hypothetical protein SALBM217S_00984 [Streptomyces griseoloalbus]